MQLPPRLLKPLRRYGAIALGGIAVVTIVTWVWATDDNDPPRCACTFCSRLM